MNHEIKCWPEPFSLVLSGRKRHEIRVYDRPYAEGDTVTLLEFDPENGYTGRSTGFVIGHVTRPKEWGLPDNLCVFSLCYDCATPLDKGCHDT